MAGPTRDRGDDEWPPEDIDARWGELELPPQEDDPVAPPPPRPTRTTAPGPRDCSPAPETEDEDGDPGRDLVDGFVPPEPDLRDAQPVVVVGWLAVLGGLAVMMLCVLAWRTAPGLVWLAAAASLAVGIGILLWRLPSRREPDDYDDGAIV